MPKYLSICSVCQGNGQKYELEKEGHGTRNIVSFLRGNFTISHLNGETSIQLLVLTRDPRGLGKFEARNDLEMAIDLKFF